MTAHFYNNNFLLTNKKE